MGREKFYDDDDAKNNGLSSNNWYGSSGGSPMYDTSASFNDSALDDERPSGTHWQRFVDSFKPAQSVKGSASAATGSTFTRSVPGGEGGHSGLYDVDAAAAATAQSPLARKLKGRHLQMIAIGGSIGW
jgi:hypothetical protein